MWVLYILGNAKVNVEISKHASLSSLNLTSQSANAAIIRLRWALFLPTLFDKLIGSLIYNILVVMAGSTASQTGLTTFQLHHHL